MPASASTKMKSPMISDSQSSLMRGAISTLSERAGVASFHVGVVVMSKCPSPMQVRQDADDNQRDQRGRQREGPGFESRNLLRLVRDIAHRCRLHDLTSSIQFVVDYSVKRQ